MRQSPGFDLMLARCFFARMLDDVDDDPSPPYHVDQVT